MLLSGVVPDNEAAQYARKFDSMNFAVRKLRSEEEDREAIAAQQNPLGVEGEVNVNYMLNGGSVLTLATSWSPVTVSVSTVPVVSDSLHGTSCGNLRKSTIFWLARQVSSTLRRRITSAALMYRPQPTGGGIKGTMASLFPSTARRSRSTGMMR